MGMRLVLAGSMHTHGHMMWTRLVLAGSTCTHMVIHKEGGWVALGVETGMVWCAPFLNSRKMITQGDLGSP